MRPVIVKVMDAARALGRQAHSAAKPDRSYADAVASLNTVQSNFATINEIRKTKKGANEKAIPEMIGWVGKIGYKPSDFNRLNAIHIAGTKGKGSTAAFVSSILSQYLPSSNSEPLLKNIGLYTSPHLRFVRERIRINQAPIPEQLFAKYFFEVWDSLEKAAEEEGAPSFKPVYFRFLTMMAFHTFLKENVDTAILECGIGGEYDSTNVLESPTVTGITSLGIDHTSILGETIEEIAWHKAGIMKPGALAFTAPQPENALEVLKTRASEKGVELQVVQPHPDITEGKATLGLEGEFQKLNASLAVALAAAHLNALGYKDIKTDTLPEEFVRGLKLVQWGGRCETREEPHILWHIDGGHTKESIHETATWFASRVANLYPPRILLFNQQTRAGVPLLRELHATVAAALKTKQPFTHAVFCTNITSVKTGYKPDLVSVNNNDQAVESLDVQRELAAWWRDICGSEVGNDPAIVRTIEEAIKSCRSIATSWAEADPANKFLDKPRILVTGSVHLVGGFLEVLETE